MPKISKILSVVALAALFAPLTVASAVNTDFTQVINSGVLNIGIVDGTTYATVGSPSVAFSAVTESVACQTSTGTLGTAGQTLYIENPNAANSGWTVSMAASATTALWAGTNGDYDFNDATGSGCTDGGDTDSFGGQLSVDPTTGTIQVGQCSGCTTTGVTAGSASAFVEGSADSITLLAAAAGADDLADYRFTGISLSQEIPGNVPAGADYAVEMVVSIVAL